MKLYQLYSADNTYIYIYINIYYYYIYYIISGFLQIEYLLKLNLENNYLDEYFLNGIHFFVLQREPYQI